ncbi:hypothetical protein [Cupriavidus sp. PET2-C1]
MLDPAARHGYPSAFTSRRHRAAAYLALTTVNRALPAMATSLGLLGVPVFGSLCSALVPGEPLGWPLLGAMAMIVGGVALGIWHPAGAPPRPPRPSR